MSPTVQLAEPTPSTSATQSPQIRKRRRRITSGGANDDCFACQKKGKQCDRRRPYCSQCLEVGKECAGYKTQLTWGVGVASRGKLRGLSLPVVNSTQKAAQASPDPPKARELPVNRPALSEGVAIKGEEVYNFGLPVGSALSSPSPYSSSTPIPIPTANQQWRMPSWHGDSNDDFVNSFKQRASYRPPPLQQRSYSFSVGSFDDFAFSAPSTGCGSTFSESDFPSPHELPPTPESMSCNEPVGSNMDLFTFGQDSVQQVSAPFSADVSQSLTMGGDLAFNFPMDSLDGQCMSVCSVPSSVPAMSMSAGFIDSISLAPAPAVLASSDDGGFYFGSVPATVSPAMLSSLSPRVSQLIDYYDKAICPILVTVDGPKNPYRVHILALAQTGSPALTNAVAALSANVLHQRTAASVNPPGYSMSPLSLSQPRGASDESLQFKAQAVALFNAAAHDPAAAHDDAMLATLVVLALFGISEGGVANLQSQLPEVRQIVAMRGGNGSLAGSVGGSAFLHWAAAFFAWLDVMAATVSDKEAQMRTPFLDMLDFSASLGALDHLAFSEGRMLKVVARMAVAAPQQTHLSPHGHPHRPHHAHSSSFGGVASVRQATDTRRPSINPFTGLPLASPPPQATTFAAAVAASAEMTASLDSVIVNGSATGNPADARQEFWSEWAGVRARLRRMTRDASAAAAAAAGAPGSTTPGVFPASPAMRPGISPIVGGAPSPAKSEAEAEQVTHAAEAFRQAALLFAERAAAVGSSPAAAAMSPPSPTSPSPPPPPPTAAAAAAATNSPAVQQLVAAIMHHVSRVPAASPLQRVLAWPLLVAGSDAVRPAHRDLVRLRAPDAMREPGFCGAASALDVLERAWAADDGVVAAPPAWWDMPAAHHGGWQSPRVSALGAAAAAKWTAAMVGMQMELGLM